jgi:hypothetical protein
MCKPGYASLPMAYARAGSELLVSFLNYLFLTYGEAIKRYLKAWDVPRDLCLNRSAWKAAIDVPEP